MSTMRVFTVAATLGLLSAGTVSGAIVHHDPPDIVAHVTSIPPMFSNVATASFDIDQDGFVDAEIGALRASPFGSPTVSTWIEPVRVGVAIAGDGEVAHQFSPPTPVGATGQGFHDGPGRLWETGLFQTLGHWSPAQTALAGVRFDRGGVDHFAWLRVRVEAPGPDFLPSVTLLDWAWEDQPGVPIVAGAVPAPGALLAMPLWAGLARRRRHHPTNASTERQS